MNNLTIVIPFFNGYNHIYSTLNCIPAEIPVVIVDDLSDEPFSIKRDNTSVYRMPHKGYFTGAVNFGIERTVTDVLVLNQDVTLTGTEWLDVITKYREGYALIGERIKGNHPAFPHGYVHGVFQFMRRDAINQVGLMDEKTYPLWGGTALWQWQICRKGFKSLPLAEIPGLYHHHHQVKRTQRYGDSIIQILQRESDKQDLFIRTPPAVSVIVPCYNYGRYLPDVMASLFGGESSLGHVEGQSFQSFEVIIVDDGSTDETPLIAQEYVTGWNGVRYIRQENQGTSGANNTGIRNALGKYITILSADDMRDPESLRILYESAIRNPGRVLYDEIQTFHNGALGSLWPLADYDFDTLLERNMMHAGIFFEKAAWEKAGGYPLKMKWGREDWAFNIALGEQGYCGLKINYPGYLYRREGQNRTLSNTTLEWRQRFYAQLVQLFPNLYKGERPMACCGSSKQKTSGVSAPRGARTMSAIPGGNEMVLMEYKGRNVGSVNYGGPGTVPSGRYYRFGANGKDTVKYVATSDVDWFLNHRENGLPIFFLQRQPPVVKSPTLPEGVVPVTGDLTIQVHRIIEDTSPKVESVESPVAGEGDVEIKAPEVQTRVLPNPETMTLKQIEALTLTPEEWRELGKKEMKGRKRTNVLTFIKSKVKHD